MQTFFNTFWVYLWTKQIKIPSIHGAYVLARGTDNAPKNESNKLFYKRRLRTFHCESQFKFCNTDGLVLYGHKACHLTLWDSKVHLLQLKWNKYNINDTSANNYFIFSLWTSVPWSLSSNRACSAPLFHLNEMHLPVSESHIHNLLIKHYTKCWRYKVA